MENDMEDVPIQSPPPIRKRTSRLTFVPPITALIGGAWFYLANDGPLTALLIVISVIWGAILGLVTLVASLFFARSQAAITNSGWNSEAKIVWLGTLCICAIVGATVLICLFQICRFLRVLVIFDGLGPGA
jgi:hypothetical protein